MKFIRRASIPACLLVCLFLVFCAYSNLFHKSAIESEQEENLELTTVFRYENGWRYAEAAFVSAAGKQNSPPR